MNMLIIRNDKMRIAIELENKINGCRQVKIPKGQ